MAKTSINVRPCNIGSAERHNLRSKELDYIRPELSHRNEQWSEMRIADVLEDIRKSTGSTPGSPCRRRRHPSGGSGRDRGRHDTPAASGLCREVGGALRNTHVPNLHAQGRRSQRLGRERGNMEAELPCAHDFRLDGRGNGEDPEAEQAGHGGNADHTGGMPWHGRGISSDRKHLSAIQYKNMVEAEKAAQIEKECRQMENKRNSIEEKVKQAGEKLEDTQKKLKEAAAEVKVEKLKGAAADTGTALLKAGTTVIDATASLFYSGKVKRQEQKIAELKREIYELEMKSQNLQSKLRTANAQAEMEREATRRAVRTGEERLKPITSLFPCMENAKKTSRNSGKWCRRQRYPAPAHRKRDNLFRIPVRPGRRKKHQVKDVKIDIAKSKAGNTTIWLNDFHFKEFFKQLWQKVQKALGLDKGMGFRR